MSQQVEISILNLVDVESFGTAAPFVRITGQSGKMQTSAAGQAEKDPSKYTFLATSNENAFRFQAESNPASFAIAVFSKDESGQITQYPGVGTINIFLDDENNANADAHCPLYEDGDEMLEIGSLIYSYNLVNAADTVAPAAEAEFSDIDFNAASLEPTPRLPVVDTPAELEPSPKATPQKAAPKPTPKPTAAPPFETMDSFDREMLREENMDQFLNDDAGNDSMYDIGSLGPNEELIVAPELHIHPEHAHLDHSHLDQLMHPQHVPNTVVPNVVHEVTLLPVPKPVDMRDWMRVAEAADNLTVADTVRADLAKVWAQCSKIIIRLHSVIVSSERVLDTTSVTAKLSVQPLPNKVVSLRSVANKGDEAGPVQTASGKGTSTTFSFGLKTAQLSMGAGDLRSKTFREGACPRLSLEIALGGGEAYSAFTELYLPALLSDCSGQVLSVPLVQSCRNDGDHNSATLSSTLLFELNPADMVTANPAELLTPRNGTAPANTVSGPAAGTSPGKKSKNKTQAAEVKTGLIPNVPSAMGVEVELRGVCGAALEAFPELTASASVEAYLTSSGCTETISLKNVATMRNSTAAVSIKKTFYLHSARPRVDILQLRLRNGPFPEDEIGRVCIPLVALLQVESETLLLNRPVAFNAWKFSNSDKGGAYLLGNWKLVGALRYQAVQPSASQKEATANMLCTTTDDLESLQYSPGTNTEGRSNWLSSPTRRSPGFETQAMGTAVPSSAKPSLVKSVSGQLVGCIKGYFSARSGLDATGNQEQEGPFFLSKGYTLHVETTLMPEGLRKKTVPATAIAQQSGDIEATVEWGKSFSMFLAYAAQQRPVPYLQVNLYAEKTTVGAAPAKNYARTLIGSCTFDASCLISYTDAPLVKCLLPLIRPGVNPSLTVLNKADVCGWLAVGFQFRPASAGGDVKADMDLTEAALQAQWTSLIAFSTQYCLGLSTYADPNSVAAIKALQANPNKLQNGSLHVALSTLQFAAQTGSSNVQSDWEDSEVTCVVKVGSDPDSSVQISGAIQNDQAVWFKPDAVMKFARESSTSACLFVYLLRGRFDAAMTDASTVVAAANLTLSQDQLQKGLPINFSLPLRDTAGERSATLGLSVQLTTIGDSAELSGDVSSTFAPSATANNNTQSPVPLRIEFCEGNIADSDDHMEPFFECSLLLPEHEELLAGPAYSTKARTGFLRLSDSLEYWGLDCTLHVPPASVASINSTTATMLATNRSRAAANSANLNSGVCVMGVVCRDASKQGCPEIGWARVALPRQLVLHGKPMEQWVSLTPPSRSGASGSPITPPVGGKHSRMKLRISVDYKDYDAAYSPFGLGAVMFRVISVHDARAGVNDDLVSARVSSYSWPDGAPTDVLDLKEDNMFAQLNAHPAAYINEMSVFNEENLVGSLPVAGGFGEVKLSVKTFTTSTSYMASFPIMAATTKATESNELPAIPLLSLNLSRERVVEMVSKDGTQRPARARLEPQLQVMAAYVPYVTGKLVLHCTDVTMVTPPAETVPVGTVLKNVASPLAIRYLLGNNSSRFMFSRSFELSTTDGAGKPKPLQGPPTLNQIDNVTFMEVNTFEIISNSIRRGENFSMLPLFVSLLEQWDLLDPAVDRRGQQSCVGIGYISTAALYYQALRAAASTPMKVQSSSSASQAGNTAGGALPSTAVAASPWLVSKVDIFDPKSKLKVAVISLNIQFVMSGLPDHVVRMLSNTVSKSIGDASAKARIELGLKQSFVLADVDKSGAVSSAELLQVINNSGRANARGRPNNKSGRLMATQKGETIGMENAVDLLFHLANVSEAEMNAVDEQSLNDLVRKIFAQLDVDGDGLVSWWEWKCVLCASILGHNSASKFMYHLDALVIGAQAANDALKTLFLTLPAEDNYDSKAGAQHSMLPYIKLKMKHSDNLSEPVIFEEDDGLLTPELQPSKTVSRLHSMVKSLRLTNSILAKRFERALSTAQNLSIDLDQDALQHSASNAGASRQGAKLSEIEYLEARIHDTEKQSEQNLSSFLTAKERADRLSAQLLEMKSTADIMEQSRSKPELFGFNAQLEQEIAANAEKLRIAQQMRKQRSSEIFSAFRLKAMISKFLMPKVYQRRKDKAAAQLAHVLQSQAVRRNYLAEKEKRKQAALVLQGAGRGLLGRKRVKEMNLVATKTQNLFRGKMARRTLANLKEQKAEREAAENQRKQQIKLNMAAFVVTRFVRNCAHRNREEKNSAALRLQSLLKKRLDFKAAKKVVNEKRADRVERHAEERRLAEELARMTAAEKARAEEERRRQEAAMKLTRALSMRSGLVEGRKIHAFLAAQNGLRQIERPDMPDIAGSWVGYPQSMSTHPADSTEAQSSFMHFGRGNYGNIQKVDARTRIMDVLFLYNKVEGASSKSGAKFELEKLPYDHPLLDFYTNEPLPKPDQGYWVNYAQEGEHHWLPFKPFTDRPDQIEDTLGYKVGLRADAQDEGALYPGRIVAFDRVKDTVCILFDAGDPNDDPDQEDVHWKSEDIQWLMPATVSRPKTIEEAVGFNVEVNKAQSTVEAHRAVRGTVIGFDKSRQTVRVVYAPPPGLTEATEVENLDFVSPAISWLNKVPLDQLPRSPRPNNAPSGPSFSKLIATTRPTDILATVGHLVEVKSTDPDAEPGDMFSGVVIAADSRASTVRVLYDSSEGRKQATAGDGAGQAADAPDEEEDYEDLPWMSPDILWVKPETDPIIPNIDSRRPRTLGDAVGLHVDVLSHEPDAVDGDYFSGVVISVDNAKQTIRVLFDGEDNGDDDFEDIPWNSQDIHWLTDESLRGRDALSLGDSVSLIGPAQDANHRPATVSEAVGRTVKVGAEFMTGEVVSVDAKSSAVWVVFNTVANAPAPVQVKIHWKSPHIEWLDSKVAAPTTPQDSPGAKGSAPTTPVAITAAPATVPAPVPTAIAGKKLTQPASLATSVGWTVEIRASDAEDEVYVGEVAGFDEATQMLKVLFAGEDGSLQPDDAEYFAWRSEQLHWAEGPAAQSATPGSAVSGGAGPAAAGPSAAAPVITAPAENRQKPDNSTLVISGEPKTLEESVGRNVNIVLDYVSGQVDAVSQALQTVNVLLEHNQPGVTDSLVIGLPLASQMIEWDARE